MRLSPQPSILNVGVAARNVPARLILEISMDKVLTLNIPVVLLNTPKGVTDGGILQTVRRELSISCLPDKIIESIEIEL